MLECESSFHSKPFYDGRTRLKVGASGSRLLTWHQRQTPSHIFMNKASVCISPTDSGGCLNPSIPAQGGTLPNALGCGVRPKAAGRLFLHLTPQMKRSPNLLGLFHDPSDKEPSSERTTVILSLLHLKWTNQIFVICARQIQPEAIGWSEAITALRRTAAFN